MGDKRIQGNASARAGASQRAIAPNNGQAHEGARAFGIGDALTPLAGLAGGAIGMATQNWANNKQYHQQKRLQNLQMAGNKEMADYMQQLGMKTWEETGYGAQRRQLENAGLNVGLMYGQAGQGGTTQTPSGSVTGGQAQSQPQNIGMGIEMAMNLALMKAQKENIEADTANKQAQAGASEASAGLTGEQTVTERLRQIGVDLENKLNALSLEIGTDTKEVTKQQIRANMWTAIEQANQMEIKTETDRQLQKETIRKAKADAIGAEVANDLMRSEKNVNQAQVKEIQQRMASMAQTMQMEIEANQRAWKQQGMDQQRIDQRTQELALEKIRTEFGASWANKIKQWTSIFTDIISSVSGGGTSGSPNPIGFKIGGGH